MLRFAVRNLFSRPARTLLSLMGLTVAIAGMVGLFSVAAGLDETIQDTFGRVPGLLAMQRGAPIPIFSRIPRAWAKEVEELPGVNVVSAEIWVRVNVINEKQIASPPRFLFGADIDAHARLNHSVYESAIVEGRYLEDRDDGSQHVVISRQIAEEFEVSVGDTMQVNNVDMTIIGIYHCGSMLLDTAIIAEQQLVRQMSLINRDIVCSFYVEPTGEISNDELVVMIRDRFRGRNLMTSQQSPLLMDMAQLPEMPAVIPSGNLLVDFFRTVFHSGSSTTKTEIGNSTKEPSNEESANDSDSQTEIAVTQAPEDPLDIRSASDWASRFDEFTKDLDIFLMIMTSIGLTIATLSIINTMLMSVSERIIEFGILKANGWSRGNVMKLITCESAVIGFVGGVFGCLAGWTMTIVVNWNWPAHIHLVASPGLLFYSLVFAIILGVVGGLYPALWATRMMPMDAIRRG